MLITKNPFARRELRRDRFDSSTSGPLWICQATSSRMVHDQILTADDTGRLEAQPNRPRVRLTRVWRDQGAICPARTGGPVTRRAQCQAARGGRGRSDLLGPRPSPRRTLFRAPNGAPRATRPAVVAVAKRLGEAPARAGPVDAAPGPRSVRGPRARAPAGRLAPPRGATRSRAVSFASSQRARPPDVGPRYAARTHHTTPMRGVWV